MKRFAFWSGVGIVVCVGSYVLIRFLKKHEENLQAIAVNHFTETRREAGFHAIAKDHAALNA